MSFDLQPILKGELLELRPLRAEDVYDLYAVAAHPLIWVQHPTKDRYKEEVFKVFFREALESGGALLVINSTNGQVLLGRHLQQGNETAYATARLQIRKQRYLSCRSTICGPRGPWKG